MKILVVEDEHKIANSIKKGLEQEKYIVDLAFDGETGFDMASDGDFDVIVLDRMLPALDGMEVCRRLRNEGNQTPILILTAKGQIEDRVEGLDSGADDYLVKPFAFTELVARIRALGRRPADTIGKILSVEDLHLDPVNFTVSRSGAAIKLSRKEFAILEYLMRHANRTVSKDQLLNAVWNYEADVLPNTVEVFVANLRGKIDRPFKNKPAMLHTVRGFGYKIGGEN